MEFELIHLGFAFFAAVFVKAVDYIEDDMKKDLKVKWVLAALYGIIIGYLISVSVFSSIFLAAALSQIFMKKVDTNSHIFGYLVMAIAILFFGFPPIELFSFVFFLIFSSLDELDHLIFWDKPKWVAEFRPFLELAALIFVFFGQYQYLIGLLAFDIGYISTPKIMEELGY